MSLYLQLTNQNTYPVWINVECIESILFHTTDSCIIRTTSGGDHNIQLPAQVIIEKLKTMKALELGN